MPLNIDVLPDRPYEVDPSVSERRYRSLRLISQLLTLTDLYDAHHREMLSIAIWKWTEAVGVRPYAKYNIPLVSARVMDRNEPVKVHHEHVWARKWMVDRLLAERPWSETGLREFLEEHGVACIVTVEEHGRLGAVREQGWTRYLAAGVEVWDRKAQGPLYLVAVRAHYLAAPVTIANRPEYEGCRSWVPLRAEDAVPDADSVPVLDPAMFAGFLARVDASLTV